MPLTIFLLAAWEGFPFSLIGLPMVLGPQIYGAIVFAGAAAYVVGIVRRNAAPGRWEILAMVAFAWCVLVSFIYSVFIAPQPVAGWLPAIFSVSPLLLILLMKACGATYEDAESAFFWLALLGPLLVIANNISGLDLLSPYARASSFSEGRVVIFKYPTVFGLVIALVRGIHAPSLGGKLFCYGAALVMGYDLVFLTESRLAILALALALAPIYAFCLRPVDKIVAGTLAPFILVPLGIFLFNYFLKDFSGLDAYLKSDTSASFRLTEIEYFGRYFRDTHGLGFGFMSGDPQYNNILNFLHYQAGHLVGTGDYGMELVDIGLYAALYQYGYVGLVIFLALTGMMGFTLSASFRHGRAYTPAAACGFLVFTFLISPIPLNFFTIFATAHCGGLLWFMAAQISSEVRIAGQIRRQREAAETRAM